MDADDRAYEFLLSDHPAAKAERQRRRDEHLARRTADSEAITAWRARLTTFGAGAPANLHNLAETMGRLDDRATLRDAAEHAEPDEVCVARARQRFTATARTWGEDPDYRYPTRYLGLAAADQPNLLAAGPASPTPTARPAPSAPRPEGPSLGL